MSHSPEIDKITEAMAKAQAAIKPATKNKKNPHFKSTYADLASIMEACKEPLAANGLAIWQFTEISDSVGLLLVTLCTHTSGQWMRGEMPLSMTNHTPQQMGSQLTYYK